MGQHAAGTALAPVMLGAVLGPALQLQQPALWPLAPYLGLAAAGAGGFGAVFTGTGSAAELCAGAGARAEVRAAGVWAAGVWAGTAAAGVGGLMCAGGFTWEPAAGGAEEAGAGDAGVPGVGSAGPGAVIGRLL